MLADYRSYFQKLKFYKYISKNLEPIRNRGHKVPHFFMEKVMNFASVEGQANC